MAQKLQVSIQTAPKELFGSTVYTVSVDVTNPTNTTIEKVSVIPQFLPGTLILREEPLHTALVGLQSEKQSLARAMEIQALHAYERQNAPQEESFFRRLISWWGKLVKASKIRIDYGPIHWDIDTEEFIPGFSKELFSIESLNDVERLEREIILHEHVNSPERKLFLLGKGKLLEKMSEIEKKEVTKENLKDEYSMKTSRSLFQRLVRRRAWIIQFLLCKYFSSPGSSALVVVNSSTDGSELTVKGSSYVAIDEPIMVGATRHAMERDLDIRNGDKSHLLGGCAILACLCLAFCPA
jgi:hypothetical protein